MDKMDIEWTGLAITNLNGDSILTAPNFTMPAVLDSGTTLTALPQPYFDMLFDYFGVVNYTESIYLVRCNISEYPGTVVYGFGAEQEGKVQVPYSELAVPVLGSNGAPIPFTDGSDACLFGFWPVAEGADVILGDTFLRSAYVVYDMDKAEISIAQTIFGAPGPIS